MSHTKRISDVTRVLGRLKLGRVTAGIGALFLSRWQSLASILAVLWGTVMLAFRPRSWSPAVSSVFMRQMLFTGVDGVFVACRFGAAVGILLIVQAALWVDLLGLTTEVVAPLLWRAIVREIAPLLACMVVVGRSGIAISTELATMVVGDEIEVLDSQGIDPMTFLVMPRILSMALSAFCLGIVIASSMLATGYVVGWFMGAIRMSWITFMDDILREFGTQDILFFVTKTVVAGGFAAAICCLDGLKAGGTITDVPRVASRSGIRSLTAIFAVSAVLSILIYGRISVFKIYT